MLHHIQVYHYVFQLFNPFTDLTIQQIDFQEVILDDLELKLETTFLSNISVELKGAYLLPLHVDVETHPAREIIPTDPTSDKDHSPSLTLGARVQLQVQYRF